MPLAAIRELVYQKLPFLEPGIEDTTIDAEVNTTFYVLQPYLNKPENQVAIEADYTDTEKLLIAGYSAYSLLKTKGIKNQVGSWETNGSALAQPLKKVQADVVEVEYAEKNSKNSFVFDAEKMLYDLATEICMLAGQLEFWLPVCSQVFGKVKVPLGFKFYPGN